MLDKLKDLFSTPKKEPDQMATTATTKEKTASKSCSTQASGPVEQLSAVGECEATVCCEAVREKAYLLWEAAGYPESDGVEFWLAAEKELQK